MLILKTDEGKTSVRVSGNFIQVCSDLCMCVKALYNGLEDKDLQELFRQFAKDMLPVLPFLDDTKLQEEEKKIDDDIVKNLTELVEMLK